MKYLIIILFAFSPLAYSVHEEDHVMVLKEHKPEKNRLKHGRTQKMVDDFERQKNQVRREAYKRAEKERRASLKEMRKTGYLIDEEIADALDWYLHPSFLRPETVVMRNVGFVPSTIPSLDSAIFLGMASDLDPNHGIDLAFEITRTWYDLERRFHIVIREFQFDNGENNRFAISKPNGFLRVQGQKSDYMVNRNSADTAGFTSVMYYNDSKLFEVMIDSAIEKDDPNFKWLKTLLDALY